MDMRSYEEAATSFRNFLRYRSDHADGYGRLGLCELQLGDYARAISDLEKAVQLRPTVGMYNYLATAHLEAGTIPGSHRDLLEGDSSFSKNPLPLL